MKPSNRSRYNKNINQVVFDFDFNLKTCIEYSEKILELGLDTFPRSRRSSHVVLSEKTSLKNIAPLRQSCFLFSYIRLNLK